MGVFLCTERESEMNRHVADKVQVDGSFVEIICDHLMVRASLAQVRAAIAAYDETERVVRIGSEVSEVRRIQQALS